MSKLRYRLRYGKTFRGFEAGEKLKMVANTCEDTGPMARLLGEVVLLESASGGNLRAVPARQFQQHFVEHCVLDDPEVLSKVLKFNGLSIGDRFEKIVHPYSSTVWQEMGVASPSYYRLRNESFYSLLAVFIVNGKKMQVDMHTLKSAFKKHPDMRNV